MFFIEKKQDGTRCIKTDDWYVVLTPTGDGTNQIFSALYYEKGRTKLQFEVSATYRISKVKEKAQEGVELKEEETEITVSKMKEFLKLFRQMDKLEGMEKTL